MQVEPIYTENNNCQDCYKCIRECPVKAIKIDNKSASIIYDDCIYCAHCTQICPAKAKKPRNDIAWTKFLLEKYDDVVVSLAPTYRADFPGIDKARLVNALYRLGFNKVSETAIGAEIVSAQTKKFIEKKKKGVFISTACPAVVNLIKKYYPHLAGCLVPLLSPMHAHGKMLKKLYGADQKVVFIGPCIAKKKEAEEEDGIIDAAITFQELTQWMEEAGVNPESQPDRMRKKLYPREASAGALYPVDGGLITGLKANTPVADVSFMTFSGIDQIREILETMQPEKIKGMLFLELMACKGGCINGPGVASHDSMAVKRHRIIKGIEKSNIKPPQDEENNIQIEKKYEPCQVKDQNVFSENEIKSALESIGKIAKTDELNCSGCGYETCRNFAIAMLKGKAERTMCVSYMRKVAQDKASVLLQKMPYGVVMVDEQMKVIECNSHFARMAGKETAMVFENKPGLSGASLVKLIPYHGYFANLIDSGAEGLEKDIKDNGRLLHLSLFTIQKHKMVCGIIHNLKVPEIQREEMVKRTQQVIEDNLATVQKVAFLLSENASRTEVTLNSLSDFNNGDQNE